MRDLIEETTRSGKRGVRLHFHPGQIAAWNAAERFVFVIAGTQSGKTTFGPWWLAREIQRCGAGDYLAVTATYDLFKLKMLPEMLRVFTGYLRADGWVWHASDRLLSSRTLGARIILRSAEADGGLESATARAAWLDECGQNQFRVDAWQAVQRRLSLTQGRALGTTTPYNLGWLKTEVFDRWRRGEDGYRVVQFRSIDNPRFPLAEYERAKSTLPAWKFEMFYNGNFHRPAGLIYDCFDEPENVVDDFALPLSWPRRVGLDFGGANQALVWVAEDTATGTYYVYRESLTGGRSTREHVQDALRHAASERVVLWMGGAPSEEQQRRDWRTEGVHVRRPKIDDVEAGIDRVYDLLKTRRLRIFRSCIGLLDELGTYSRVLDDRGQPTEKIADKSAYHRLDALRYVVSGLPIGASTLLAVSYQG